MTIEQRYSMLTLDKCSGISGYYRDETMIESEKFTIGKNSQEYEMNIQNWYGDLDIYFDGERLTCYTDEQESWVKEVFDIIR